MAVGSEGGNDYASGVIAYAQGIGFLKVWTPFNQQAVTREMSGFSVLTADGLVQSAQYGDDMQVVVNFSTQDQTVNGMTVKAQSAVITEQGKQIAFDAAANAKLLNSGS